MITFTDVSTALEAVLKDVWEDQRQDFENRLSTDPQDENLGDHMFLQLLVLHNALRVLGGEPESKLQDVVEEPIGLVYRCEDCGFIGSHIEPVPDRVFTSFEPGDIVPAGCCLRCGAVAFPL
jgi:hypothetical protein